VDKITKKQLRGYLKAKRDTITFNDSYNLDVYGIDQETYGKINKTVSSMFGICPPTSINLAALNRHFSDLRHTGDI